MHGVIPIYKWCCHDNDSDIAMQFAFRSDSAPRNFGAHPTPLPPSLDKCRLEILYALLCITLDAVTCMSGKIVFQRTKKGLLCFWESMPNIDSQPPHPKHNTHTWKDYGTTGCHIISILKCVGKAYRYCDIPCRKDGSTPLIFGIQVSGGTSIPPFRHLFCEGCGILFQKKEAGEEGHLHTH